MPISFAPAWVFRSVARKGEDARDWLEWLIPNTPSAPDAALQRLVEFVLSDWREALQSVRERLIYVKLSFRTE
jgi:hypothetical protein